MRGNGPPRGSPKGLEWSWRLLRTQDRNFHEFISGKRHRFRRLAYLYPGSHVYINNCAPCSASAGVPCEPPGVVNIDKSRGEWDRATGVAAAQSPIARRAGGLGQREIMPSTPADRLIGIQVVSNVRVNNFSGSEMGRNGGESLNKLGYAHIGSNTHCVLSVYSITQHWPFNMRSTMGPRAFTGITSQKSWGFSPSWGSRSA